MNKRRLGRLLLGFLSALPKKYPIRTQGDPPDPFFIINAGRSGSTLLNRLLNQHSAAFLPPEQYFLHNLIIKFQLYNWMLWRDLGKVLAGELVSSLGAHAWEWDYEKTFRDIVLAEGEDRSLRRIVDKVIRDYAVQTGASPAFWGDTTPLNAQYINELFSVYPKAKYIFLVRDGRDVVASYQGGSHEVHQGLSEHVECAKHWRDVARVYRWLEKRGAALRLVKYEDLVADTSTVMAGIVDFLGLDGESLDTNKVDVPDIPFYALPHHEELRKPIHDQRIGRWKSILSAQQLDQIMPILERPMKDFDYLG
ncbi:MAG: sulfotransferase [Bacteroidota bacterium]